MVFHGGEAQIGGRVDQAQQLFTDAIGTEKKAGVAGKQRTMELASFVQRAHREAKRPPGATYPKGLLDQMINRKVMWCRSRLSA